VYNSHVVAGVHCYRPASWARSANYDQGHLSWPKKQLSALPVFESKAATRNIHHENAFTMSSRWAIRNLDVCIPILIPVCTAEFFNGEDEAKEKNARISKSRR